MSKRTLSIVFVLALTLVATSTLYVIQETELAVKLRFGRLIETDIQPGFLLLTRLESLMLEFLRLMLIQQVFSL